MIEKRIAEERFDEMIMEMMGTFISEFHLLLGIISHLVFGRNVTIDLYNYNYNYNYTNNKNGSTIHRLCLVLLVFHSVAI